MGRKRPVVPHQDIPWGLEFKLLNLVNEDPTGFSRLTVACEGNRNEVLSETMAAKGIIPGPAYLQSASDDRHGQDAWWFRDPDAEGVIPMEATEIKTKYHLEPYDQGNRFEYHSESVNGYERLVGEHQLFATFRRCPDGLERVVEIYVLFTGSLLHEQWNAKLEKMKADPNHKGKRFGYSLKQIKEMEAIKLV